MKANTRLMLSIVVIATSAIYGLLVVQEPRFAEAIAVGYIAILLTIIAVINVWKSP